MNVHVMSSVGCAAIVKLVPGPAGNAVDDPPAAFVHEIELVYWPNVLADPGAIVSLSVYVAAGVPVATVTTPPVIVEPDPAVVAVPPPGPAIDMTNWSVALNRFCPFSDLRSTSRGAAMT